MSNGRNGNRDHEDYGGVATLVRSLPVRLVEVSRSGCRLECSRPIESGTSGQLAVELGGVMRIDDIRIARCQMRMGAGPIYQVGAELLRTRRLGRRTVRMAIKTIIDGRMGAGHARNDHDVPIPASVRTTGAGGRSESRAPPAQPSRGP